MPGLEFSRPGTSAYEHATSPRNSITDQHPALVVSPRSVAELADAVAYAAQHGLTAGLAPATLSMMCPSIARWPGTEASSVPWRIIIAGAPARVDAAIFARVIRLNEALRSHLLRDAVKDVALARVLGNGATAGTRDAAPAGVIVILAVLLDSACAGPAPLPWGWRGRRGRPRWRRRWRGSRC
jgi:hypothetical protein